MKEWILRRGFTKEIKVTKLPWQFWFIFLSRYYVYEYKRYFIDLINEKGEVRRLYQTE